MDGGDLGGAAVGQSARQARLHIGLWGLVGHGAGRPWGNGEKQACVISAGAGLGKAALSRQETPLPNRRQRKTVGGR